MRPEHLPGAKKLAITLLTPYQFKKKIKNNPATYFSKKLIAIQPQIFEKIKNSPPELKFTDSLHLKSLLHLKCLE